MDALSNISAYQYNVADQLIQVTAPNGAVTHYEYDDLGNQRKEISPDRGTLTYVHDSAGNVTQMTDARGIVTSYAYDVLNRLISVSYPNTSENVSYQYDTGPECGAALGRGLHYNWNRYYDPDLSTRTKSMTWMRWTAVN